jgi:hypothetical protein
MKAQNENQKDHGCGEKRHAAEEWLQAYGVNFVEPTAPAARINFAFDCERRRSSMRGTAMSSVAPWLDGANHAGWVEFSKRLVLKRNEKGHELSKDVAERNSERNGEVKERSYFR